MTEELLPPAPPEADAIVTRGDADGMLPGRRHRAWVVERVFVRVVATGGVVGIAVALGAILVGQNVAGWIVGLVIGLASVVLSAVLWSSREL
jgi:hypothetical protein